ncbi:hypothetical protein ECEC1735_4288, partial [Escherichia coli EC1735]
LPQT